MERHRGKLAGTALFFEKYRFSTARYSFYPMPESFSPRFGPRDLSDALAARARLAARRPVVVATHLGAFRADCAEGLEAVRREALMLRALLGADKPRAIGMHSPSAALAVDARFGSLLAFLEAHFGFPELGKFLELDAREARAEALERLRAYGFTRLRLRCADARDEAALPHALREAARVFGEPPDTLFSHGRLGQSPAELASGIEHAAAAGSRCIILSADARALATGRAARAALLAQGIDALCGVRYENAGLDVFVPPGLRHGSPFRSRFDVLGLGAGAITVCGDSYAQNEPDGDAYVAALRAHRLPVARGHRMSVDDALRRDIIHSLECLGTVSFSSLEYKYGVAFERYFAPQLERLEEMHDSGLVELYGDAIEVTPAGRPVVRLVSAVFDRYLESGIVVETEKA